jgi:hypothetical protein
MENEMTSIHTLYSSDGFSAQFIGCHRSARIDMIGSDAQIARFARTMGFESVTKTIFRDSNSEGLNPAKLIGPRRKLLTSYFRAAAKLGLVGGFEGHRFAASL